MKRYEQKTKEEIVFFFGDQDCLNCPCAYECQAKAATPCEQLKAAYLREEVDA